MAIVMVFHVGNTKETSHLGMVGIPPIYGGDLGIWGMVYDIGNTQIHGDVPWDFFVDIDSHE
jgi:hypothetical protein